MSVSLTAVGGKPAVEIIDARGKAWRYWYRVMPGRRTWVLVLTALDPQTDEPARDRRTGRLRTYAVMLVHPDAWSCSCPDWRMRRRKGGEDCKHCAAARELKPVWEAMTGARAPQRGDHHERAG
jgi:hypothetical protein